MTPAGDGSGADSGAGQERDAARNPWGLNQAILLALAAAALYALFRKLGLEGIVSIALVAVGLGLVIFIHELGHFAVAKWCDVHVETFSIGFGPPIPGCSFQRGETTYKIAWFPLGGYVKMVGEGTETEEEDDDPRSFRNKSVWQRMAIISAGVIMNIILGVVCFIFVYRAHGMERPVGAVGMVDAGSPAFVQGIPAGAVFDRIGDTQNPFFDDLKYDVSLSSAGEFLIFVYHMPGSTERYEARIKPRRDKDDQYPVIGVAPMMEPKLFPKSFRKTVRSPVTHDSAASRAVPPFEFGDVITATTDPDNPARLKPLPGPDDQTLNAFEFFRRLKLLAGKPMTFEVTRHSDDKTSTITRIEVPASFHSVLPGLRMQMGMITALRENSEAATKLLANDVRKQVDGDTLKWLEVTDNTGRNIRYVTDPTEAVPAGVTRVYVDPTRLPHELSQWALAKKGDKQVRLKVFRTQDHKARAEFPPSEKDYIELTWDSSERWRFDREVPYSFRSPLAIPGLGIGYQINTSVADVDKGSVAYQAGLKPNDRIKAVRFQRADPQTGQAVSGKLQEIEADQWAYVFFSLQQLEDFKEITLQVESPGSTQPRTVFLFAQEDRSWPLADRGLVLMPAMRLQKADSIGEAIYLGMQRTERSIVGIYLNLRAMITGRVSVRSMGGPIMIASLAYEFAGQSIYDLIFFLGMISINLAVINFLPIPVLDGGHMLFLIWEKIRGVPASQTVQAVATYVGLLVILALMVLTFWVDITRLF
ncbi:MAG TPA: site-2 protease family protein [Gemmataceae bacterium]|nr:site-2 protease family protein [Gemmataceae bacterium]